MTNIKILGSGCANCQTTFKLIEAVLAEHNHRASLEKVEDFKDIMRYGVMSTPAVVIDEVVVHSGSVPRREAISAWLVASSPGPCCTPGDSVSSSGCCRDGNTSCG
ncbi:MAG: hypothetical protein B7Z82_03330 [Halothiobacillus sp. 20-54-6]|nr:MAG: hypothetical protein B7Z82_03330 [Halothiobacillus sp. 20-54-6]